MADLIQEFFQRDLSEAEQGTLSKLLEGSPDAALAYEKLLEKSYLATGLPQPSLPKGLHALAGQGGGGMVGWGGTVKFLLMGLVVAGAAFWKWWPQPKAEISMTTPPPSLGQVLEKTQGPPGERDVKKTATLKPISAGPTQEGDELKVVVNAPQKSLVTVRILDSMGHEVRALYTGFVEVGSWAYQWDGLLQNGKAAEPGNYRIDVQAGQTHMSKAIRIKSRAPGP